jgi:osmotically-inducible protein OsmY
MHRTLATTAGLVFFSLVVPCLPAAQEDLGDQKIAQAVTDVLSADDATADREIQVDVQDGVVTLSGAVKTLYQRRRAARLAGTIRGVRSVVDTLRFQGEPRPDDDIHRDVARALFADAATERQEVTVDVHDAQVQLKGTVDSFVEKMLCAQVARDVRGVRKVINRLTVEPEEARPDAEIKLEVARRLQSDVWLDDRLIEIEVDQGLVRLRGAVGSAAEKDTAEIDAWVAGVNEVDTSDLQVDPSRLDAMQRRSKLESYSDIEIRQAVLDALRYDPRVHRFGVNVAVQQGVVTLEGAVDNLAAKQAAEKDARHSIGVARVINRLEIEPRTERTSDDIAQDIHSALGRDQYVTSYNITVRVAAGVAVLSGQVGTHLAKRRAEQIAERTRGVVRVVNEIRIIQPDQEPADRTIKYKIENRIYWSPFLDHQEVSVFVDDRVATLTGIADNAAAFDTAAQIALEAGAREVNNQLVIRNVSDRPEDQP